MGDDALTGRVKLKSSVLLLITLAVLLSSDRGYSLSPIDDAGISNARGLTNGSNPELRVDKAPLTEMAYLKFKLEKISFPIQSAKIRIYVSNYSSDGPKVSLTSNRWNERKIRFRSKPRKIGAPIFDIGNLTNVGFIYIDVTKAISKNGTYSFVFTPDSEDGFGFYSKEYSNAEYRPNLIITPKNSTPPVAVTSPVPVVKPPTPVAVTPPPVTVKPPTSPVVVVTPSPVPVVKPPTPVAVTPPPVPVVKPPTPPVVVVTPSPVPVVPPPPAVVTKQIPGQSAELRQLTNRELDNALSMILKVKGNPAKASLPQDTLFPFDNYVEYLSTSSAKVQILEGLATEIAQEFVADDARMKSVLPCIPSSTTDTTCFKSIVTNMGLLFLRRPLSATEVTDLSNLTLNTATKNGSSKVGVEVFLRVMIQHPDFLYRNEIGVAMDTAKTAFQLTDLELASKLSFTIWGTPPDLQLLQAATSGKLKDPVQYQAQVDRLLNDPHAVDQLDFFHAAWLGFASMDESTTIKKQMRAETRAMIERIIFIEGKPWQNLFSLDETYVNSELATYYGLPKPAVSAGGWVKQTDPLRKGFLGTGSFLSMGAKFGDTSTTQRGYTIRKQLFCEPVAPPPPNLSVDSPPRDPSNPSRCKDVQVHATILAQGSSCISCHTKLDPIGFGLETFGSDGKTRTTQPNAPECKLSSDGEVVGYGKFQGPAGLGDVAIQSGRAELCIVQRWLNFTNGVKFDSNINEMTNAAVSDFNRDGNLKRFIRSQLVSPEFRIRKPL